MFNRLLDNLLKDFDSQSFGLLCTQLLCAVVVTLVGVMAIKWWQESNRRAFPFDFHYNSLIDRISFAATMTELAYLREEVTQFWLDCIVDGETKGLELRHSTLLESIEAREVFINKARKRIS